VVLASAVPSASGQVHVDGVVKMRGTSRTFGSSGSFVPHQYTHIWAFSPPNSSSDNSYFKSNVMPSSSIEGVSLTEAWSSIETIPPDNTPCSFSDTAATCQPDPVLPNTFHHYDWSTYDSITGGSTPVYQWLSTSFGGKFKKVNLLITGESAGTTNATTPHYVTSSSWYNLFNPQWQDVINALKDCAGVPWTGTGGTVSTWSGTTVKVSSTGCCSTSSAQSNLLQTGDLIWVTSSTSGLATPSGGSTVTVNDGSDFSYTASGTGTASSQSLTYISAAQSWPVPYEYPYMNALKAYWAAVVAHYGPNFTLNGTNYYSQLNYFRFGGSVGSEWYPYCVSSLQALSTPYTYSMSAWLNYYQQMGNYLQSLGPPFTVIHSINSAEVSPVNYTYATDEAAYAAGWSNRFGQRDGFGSQGLSALDYVNCVTNSCPVCTTGGSHCSASNWYPLFGQYNVSGSQLELQPEALSYPGDTDCSNPTCGTGNGNFSGDLPTFLYPLATAQGTTEVEIYWRDLSLAYDPTNYCSISLGACNLSSSISVDNQLTVTEQYNWFSDNGTPPNAVGIGTGCGGTQGQGLCTYESNINSAHGQH
jgi:hypothetical protein